MLIDLRAQAKEKEDLLRIEANSSKQLFITLPIPISVNDMYVNTRYGKRLNKKAERYVVVSQAKIKQAVDQQNWEISEEGQWLYVDMVFYMPDRIIRDASNCLKLGMDVFQGIAYKNDYYALPRIQSVEYDKKNPRMEVCITFQSPSEREKALKIVSK